MSRKSLFARHGTLVAIAAGAAAGALASGLIDRSVAEQPTPLVGATYDDSFVSVADLVENVAPSVVSVLVERETPVRRMSNQFDDFFFRFGFPEGRDDRERFFEEDGGVRRMEAQGSGFFTDADGHIVTNNHVIDGGDKIVVRLKDGTELDAELVGADAETDLAVLKVAPPKDQRFVSFADGVNLRVGDRVVAVGNPFGLSGTVTSGIVSALGRDGGSIGQFTDFIQIDAPINRGNSGGPTFDLKGRVVGVNTAIYSSTGGSVGIGFAIPARLAKETVAQLISTGSVTRGWLGVSLQPVTEPLAEAFGRKSTDGALVAEVLDGTPAEKAGVQSGDLIIKLNGEAVKDTRELSRGVSKIAPGKKAKVTLIRDGKEKIVNVTLGKRGDDATRVASAEEPRGSSVQRDLGLRLGELTEARRERYRVPEDVEGVVVLGVRAGSPAEEAGLRAGSVILQLDNQPVKDAEEISSKIDNAIDDGRDAVLLRTQVGGVKQFAALPLARSEDPEE
ncbi:MAG: Do family serine endopeptidase [Pseudomonadota bacterium]